MRRLVVFDIAGTTVEDPGGVRSCFQAAFEAAKMPWSEPDFGLVRGLPKPLAIRRLLGPDASPGLIDGIHADFQARMIDHYRTSPLVRPIEGAEAVFQTLRSSGVKIALDTGFDRAIVDTLLARLEWGSDVLDATVTSDEVPRGRPHADMILKLMTLLGVDDPEVVVKVGDTPVDLQEGQAAGCGIVIGVTSGAHRRAELETHPHTYILDSIREVPAVLS